MALHGAPAAPGLTREDTTAPPLPVHRRPVRSPRSGAAGGGRRRGPEGLQQLSSVKPRVPAGGSGGPSPVWAGRVHSGRLPALRPCPAPGPRRRAPPPLRLPPHAPAPVTPLGMLPDALCCGLGTCCPVSSAHTAGAGSQRAACVRACVRERSAEGSEATRHTEEGQRFKGREGSSGRTGAGFHGEAGLHGEAGPHRRRGHSGRRGPRGEVGVTGEAGRSGRRRGYTGPGAPPAQLWLPGRGGSTPCGQGTPAPPPAAVPEPQRGGAWRKRSSLRSQFYCSDSGTVLTTRAASVAAGGEPKKVRVWFLCWSRR